MTRKNVADYEIGFRRPPKATQFKKGESGNLKGRPKGSKNFASHAKALLARKTTITENGRTRRITLAEAVLMKLISRAMANDMSAMRMTLGLIQVSQPEAPPVESVFDTDADRALLLSYLDDSKPMPKSKTGKAAKARAKGGDRGL